MKNDLMEGGEVLGGARSAWKTADHALGPLMGLLLGEFFATRQ
jgi:hypothetical protein